MNCRAWGLALAVLAACGKAYEHGDGGDQDLGGSGAADGAFTADASAQSDASGGPGAIGEWSDAPGVCPAGVKQVDITTATQLASAARGEAPYDGDPPTTCYLIHDGNYTSTGVILYVLAGGVAGAPRLFLGQSRSGVIIHGRGNIESVSHVTVANLSFDLTGYVASGSFNTLTLGTGNDLTVDHVTFTGDCATGSTGGHVEVDGTDGARVDSCLIEKFGHCGPSGHLDHGVYLGSGKNIVVHNNVIRGNASRGIQLNTEGGTFGTLDTVHIDHNRIYENGHADYEDGIVVNSTGTGTISNLSIERNLVYRNFYSGVRFVGASESKVVVADNTFDSNGAGSSSASRSEINLDAAGSGNDVSVHANIFQVGNTLLDDCYDATPRGFLVGDNFVKGTIPTGACLSAQTTGDPMFVNAAMGDYHPTNPASLVYGAYAP